MKTYPRVMELLKKEADALGGNQPASKKIGIDRTSYAHYLDGTREPTTRTLQRIAAYFRTSVAYLRGETDDPKQIGAGLTAEKKLLWDLVDQMNDDEALELVIHLRKRRRDREST